MLADLVTTQWVPDVQNEKNNPHIGCYSEGKR